MDEPYVFLSYSRKDLQFVEKLSSELRDAGVRVWRDMEQLNPGERWADSIDKALSSSDALIYVSSENSRGSGWIDAELRGGLLSKKSIFPIVIDDVGAEELPELLSQYQWVNFRESHVDALDQLVTSLPDKVKTKSFIPEIADKSKGYVFISYSSNDHDFVSDLRDFLTARGYGFWDYAESDRNYHTQFVRELEGVISDAVATLSILSENWKDSTWALREYIFSEEVKTSVFLLKAKKMSPSLAVAGTPYIDFVEDKNSGFSKLDTELKRKGL